MQKNSKHALVFSIYLAFFFILFLQFPLKDCLYGNYDTWLIIVMWKTLLTKAQSLLTGEFLGTFFYPAQNVFFYGESSLITTGFCSFWKVLGLSDLWCNFLMIVFVFAGSAWAVYLLARHYIENDGSAFFAGFAFACSNYLFANMDDAPISLVLFPCLALHFFLRYIHGRERKHLIWMAVIGGLQAYLSLYTFILQSVMLGLYALIYLRHWCTREQVGKIIFPVLWYGIIPLPLFAFYLYSRAHGSVFFPWPVHLVMDGTSLRFWSLFGVLPGNLLYPAMETNYIFWGQVRIMAFLGFGLWFLALLAIAKHQGRKAELVLLALTGMAFSFAIKSIDIGPNTYSLPFYYTGDDSLLNFFRVPSRFFIVTSLALSVLAGMGMETLRQWMPSAWMKTAVMVVFILFHCVENTPFPFRAYSYEPFGTPPPEYKEFFKGQTGNIILDLPSTDIAIVPFEDEELFGFNREMVYMNWQLEHRQHVLNGINGYVPSFRVYFESLTDRVFYEGDLEAFDKLRQYNLSHVVFHKDLVLKKDEGMEERLKAMPFLELLQETPRLCIFRVHSRL
ncbi:MAG: hypothetical protein JEZ02_08495 [Desulfatibacillum sp.]|nr:hypothetical protein [Desulfatibacillum sp.]